MRIPDEQLRQVYNNGVEEAAAFIYHRLRDVPTNFIITKKNKHKETDEDGIFDWDRFAKSTANRVMNEVKK